MNQEMTAILLSGGKSSRIGDDKALLKITDVPIIEDIYNLLKRIFNKIILITNVPLNYNFLNVEIYEDIYRGLGPLSGIHSGLVNSDTENNFIISCDMPFVTNDLINFLIRQISEEDILIPKSNKNIHSLCAVYKKNCLPKIEELLKQVPINYNETGKTKIKLFDLINSVNTRFIEISKQSFFNEDIVFNMNTIEDFKFALNKFKKL
ncbi:MAG: molybdenum cofactor guanylyltransferase [Ignavibacteriales bacterium]|nr:molybdenum cofactor guanylyltransferase [Ignavibacteriales bacterium]